jgi:SAM-dependent methyltransferase
MDVRSHNRDAWDRNVDEGNRWTQAVNSEVISKARHGTFEILLTPRKPVPMEWFPQLSGMPTLCLASAGGQQAPVLAAAGAAVTVFDNSPKQLEQDRFVAQQRDGLEIDTVEGDMVDLSRFPDDTFGLVFHPCSNCFVPDVISVWQECHRVLRPGGVLLAGFVNRVRYLFDDERKENGNLQLRYRLPYSDLEHLDASHIQEIVDSGRALEFGHTLQDQIGGQLNAGFMLTGLFEDGYKESDDDPVSRYMSTFIATRAVR